MLCKSKVAAVHSAASSYAAMHMVASSCPVLIIAWEWHIGLALLCGCSGALEYPTTNFCGPINESLSFLLCYHSLDWNPAQSSYSFAACLADCALSINPLVKHSDKLSIFRYPTCTTATESWPQWDSSPVLTRESRRMKWLCGFY